MASGVNLSLLPATLNLSCILSHKSRVFWSAVFKSTSSVLTFSFSPMAVLTGPGSSSVHLFSNENNEDTRSDSDLNTNIYGLTALGIKQIVHKNGTESSKKIKPSMKNVLSTETNFVAASGRAASFGEQSERLSQRAMRASEQKFRFFCSRLASLFETRRLRVSQ